MEWNFPVLSQRKSRLMFGFPSLQDELSNLRYQITRGNVGGVFAVQPSTGVVYLNGELDYETLRDYNLVLVVSDGAHQNETKLHITVQVWKRATIILERRITICITLNPFILLFPGRQRHCSPIHRKGLHGQHFRSGLQWTSPSALLHTGDQRRGRGHGEEWSDSVFVGGTGRGWRLCHFGRAVSRHSHHQAAGPRSTPWSSGVDVDHSGQGWRWKRIDWSVEKSFFIDLLFFWLISRSVLVFNWLIVRLIVRLIVLLMDWLIDWLIDFLQATRTSKSFWRTWTITTPFSRHRKRSAMLRRTRRWALEWWPWLRWTMTIRMPEGMPYCVMIFYATWWAITISPSLRLTRTLVWSRLFGEGWIANGLHRIPSWYEDLMTPANISE